MESDISSVLVRCNEDTHKYESDEHVQLWMNTVGPYHNRQETYEYFSLPFCKGEEHENVGKIRHHHNIGDALQVFDYFLILLNDCF